MADEASALPQHPALPPIPADAEGPVFRAPWEAQAFAMAVALHRAGHFTWPEWVDAMSAQITRAQAEGDPDLGQTYYRHWLAALEAVMLAKRLAGDSELRLRRLECAANAAGLHLHPARRTPVHIG